MGKHTQKTAWCAGAHACHKPVLASIIVGENVGAKYTIIIQVTDIIMIY